MPSPRTLIDSPMKQVKILTVNARGLKNRWKRLALFTQLRTLKCDIVCLQETHITSKDSQQWEKEWGGQLVYVQGTNNSRGEIVLFSRNTPLSVNVTHKEDRILILSVKSEEFSCTICNVYAPNRDAEKILFFDKLSKIISRYEYDSSLFLGDSNIAMNNELDNVSGNQH